MQIQERVHIVGSGALGFGLSDAYDCHVFLLDGGGELALLDVGAGMSVDAILANVRAAGFDPERIRHVIATHAHADHAGGLARMVGALDGPTVYAAPEAAGWLRTGDEAGASLDVAKAAGIYPADYVLEPCDVDVAVAQGDVIAVGDLRLEVHETPGHARGHVSLLYERDGARTLFSGDALFHGGSILLQNVHDCSLEDQIRTLRHLRGLRLTALIPSHLAFDLRDGQRHVERANDALDRLLIPNQLFSAW